MLEQRGMSAGEIREVFCFLCLGRTRTKNTDYCRKTRRFPTSRSVEWDWTLRRYTHNVIRALMESWSRSWKQDVMDSIKLRIHAVCACVLTTEAFRASRFSKWECLVLCRFPPGRPRANGGTQRRACGLDKLHLSSCFCGS